MIEEKEYLETFIKKELEQDAEDIRRENAADEEGKVMPEQIKAEIWQRLSEEIEEHERNSRYCNLTDEEYHALRLGQEMMVKEKTEKQSSRRKRGFRFYAGAASVFVLVMAVSISSFGGAERIMRLVRSVMGSKEVVKVNSNDDNLVIVKEDEEKAYQTVKEKFGVEPVKIIIGCLPEMEFESMELDKSLQLAEFSYLYHDERIVYLVGAFYRDSSWAAGVDDKIIDEYQIEKKQCTIKIKEYDVTNTNKSRYSVNFNYMNLEYFLLGTMKKTDLQKIIENFHFVS